MKKNDLGKYAFCQSTFGRWCNVRIETLIVLNEFHMAIFYFAISLYNASKKWHYYIVLHCSSIISLLLVLYVVKYTPFAIIPYPNAWKKLNRPRHLNFIRKDSFKFRLWTYLYASLPRGKVWGRNFKDLTKA